MRRLGVIVALGALLAMFGGVMTASPALARGPKWQFEPHTPVTLATAEFCGFDIRITFPVNRVFTKTLKASDGSVTTLTTGSEVDSFTNLETGKTITENVSGPSKTTFFPDGSFTAVEHGRNEFILTPAQAAQFGLPIVAVTVGRRSVSGTFGPPGTPPFITSISLHGYAIDMCAALS